jgi:hypothetical protein
MPDYRPGGLPHTCHPIGTLLQPSSAFVRFLQLIFSASSRLPAAHTVSLPVSITGGRPGQPLRSGESSVPYSYPGNNIRMMQRRRQA